MKSHSRKLWPLAVVLLIIAGAHLQNESPEPAGAVRVSLLQGNFTQEEKDALVAFLKTLTDEQMLQDPKFSDPFVVE